MSDSAKKEGFVVYLKTGPESDFYERFSRRLPRPYSKDIFSSKSWISPGADSGSWVRLPEAVNSWKVIKVCPKVVESKHQELQKNLMGYRSFNAYLSKNCKQKTTYQILNLNWKGTVERLSELKMGRDSPLCERLRGMNLETQKLSSWVKKFKEFEDFIICGSAKNQYWTAVFSLPQVTLHLKTFIDMTLQWNSSHWLEITPALN